MVVLVRIALLAIGMGTFEIGLGSALVEGSLGGWALMIFVAAPTTIAGSAGFMGPLLGSRPRERSGNA